MKKNAVIGCIPRSGTNFIGYFSCFYGSYLEDSFLTPENFLEHANLFQWKERSHKKLGFNLLVIGHAYCPGFREHGNSPYKPLWDTILYDTNWWNGEEDVIRRHSDVLYPQLNPNVRIALLYRNPLDLMVSLYRHVQTHKTPPAHIETFENFVTHYFSQYIKIYVSYIETRRQFPNNVVLLPYEELMAEPEKKMKELLAFIGCPVTNDAAFRKALASTTPEAMRRLELHLGQTLARDQKLPASQESHMRGGETGKWRKHFSDALLKQAEEELQRFDLSLKHFILDRSGTA